MENEKIRIIFYDAVAGWVEDEIEETAQAGESSTLLIKEGIAKEIIESNR